MHWKKVSLAENSIHMERFTTRCSYWALAYLQLRSTFLERCTGQSSQRVTFKQRGITVVIKYGDFVRIEIEMVGTSQKGLGCTAPQLSMPPHCPLGWIKRNMWLRMVEHCLLDKFPRLRIFFVVQNLLGLPTLRKGGALGLARTESKVTWCWGCDLGLLSTCPRSFNRFSSRISVTGLIFRSGPTEGASKASLARWYTYSFVLILVNVGEWYVN